MTFVLLAGLGLVIYFTFNSKNGIVHRIKVVYPSNWQQLLEEKVSYYRQLSEPLKRQFEKDVQGFLARVTITGVRTEVTFTDRLLVASSGVIPLFGFPACTYRHLNEVILYPTTFNRQFQLDDPDEMITGMVGSGKMEGKMILSKPALHEGFENDHENTALHEFIHLFDKENGMIDGVPPGFEDRSFAMPWIQFVHRKIKEIAEERSDIRAYAAMSPIEFFAVAGEYFFERPELMRQRHPDLYELLTKTFKQQPHRFLKQS
jgi:hypothetical protein